MNEKQPNRRKFLKESVATAAGIIITSAIPTEAVRASANTGLTPLSAPNILTKSTDTPRIKFSAIGLNHGHIYGQVEAVIRGGGQLVSFYAKEPDLAAAFSKRYPDAKVARSEKEILEDKSIQLVVSASIPDERAPLGIEVMKNGKDFMVDKPGITSLEQLDQVRKVQKQTGRIYSIMYSERLENRATVKAGELVKAGAIGKVIQTIGLGPHRINLKSRPEWFFDRKRFGGIICDIGSHQCDQFLFFTGSTKAEIVSSQVGNVHYPQYPLFEDFGDVVIRGDKGTGYIRVDWFTPDGLNTWGDGRLTILGTEGYIELRKNIDIAGRPGGNHLFLVDNKNTQYIDCSQEELPYGKQLVDDVLNRTQTAMSQEHCFLATEVALKAQKQAQQLKINT
ncbi:Gfo/Idh/MocA family oxidoreductase [Rhodocytophaga aerolata]|uniref:Gfo/Idh/MocA family oxidoreductase n=1 Tax=Rhodocytophaga aerolata TaxID=455078 RepID=A0ABT8RHD9_9BACT|nr:Gfo/Idh/MocA family oxidoreductase [Rhodocytophaga aerolata]MDO1450583.1 Gfo/Idh/MocA family oxidoreductase [Rhodocytophaga aerolata]